ncbi:hypothetical protein V5O48_004823, partial [Marasmius crinis-equi]
MSGRDLMEGLQIEYPIATLPIPVAVENGLTADISNLQYIGSYNWLEAPHATIIVPGSPREWLKKNTPYTVQADTEERFVDQNAFRIPASPLLPLIACVDHLHRTTKGNEAFRWASVDIVTDRNGLRKLLRWIRGNTTESFRIDLQLAGQKTVLFTRWEPRTKAFPEYYGHTFGHNFEEAATSPAKGCEGETGHHRVVQYDFGGLRLVVRCEVDAYLPAFSKSQPALAVDPTKQKTETVVSSGNTTLTIREAGTIISQESLVELKTTSRKRFNAGQCPFDEIIPQMFIAQTPHLFLGIHERGYFSQVLQGNISG